MPQNSFVHPISIKNYLKYFEHNSDIDFAKYNDEKYDYEVINSINIPLFMRWGDTKELIEKRAEDLVKTMINKINNKEKSIGYIEGADHTYSEKEKILANEISDFLKRVD